jgi:eukaryotic-like serine/threonine-protein kinase
MAAPVVPEVGGRLGPYELVSPLGVGGMAEVYRARDTRLGRDVAIKLLDFESARHPERLRLFEHEARAAGAIEHPAIVAVHDVGHEGDVPYVVLELVEGETLQRRLLRGRLPVRKALETAIQIGHGLAAAHARSILHNDLKPSNVILTRDGRVKILDFGLAGLRGGSAAGGATPSSARTTITQALFGTPGYVAPERIEGHEPDARADVFSLGAVLYEMLAGVPAFDGATTAEVLTATSERDPPEVDPPLPPALSRIVHRALEKDPAQRFQSASDLAFALEALATVTGAPVTFERRPARRWPRYLDYALVAVALGGIGVAAGRLLWDRPLPDFQRLTFRYGSISSARFAPDSRTVLYAAAWTSSPGLKVYQTRTESRGVAEAPVPEGDLAAVSSSGDLAIFPGRPNPAQHDASMGAGAPLAHVPSAGGAPRDVLPDVIAADWSPRHYPDGLRMTVVREHDGTRWLEFPIGNVLYRSNYGLRAPRFSPDGELIAAVENGAQNECVLVFEATGRRRVLGCGYTLTSASLGWSPDGKEIWFSAEKVAEQSRWGSWRPALRAISLSGRERTLLHLPEFLTFQDVAPDGRVLITAGSLRGEIVGQPHGESSERNLSWHEASNFTELSRDGTKLLFFEASEVATYLRPIDGGPAARLTSGLAIALSPDGNWVVRTGLDQYSGHLLLVPTGSGEPRAIAVPPIAPWGARWFTDSRHLLLTGNEEGKALRAWVVDTAGASTPRPITPEGIGCWLLSPDDRTAACVRPPSEGYFYSLDGGAMRPMKGFVPGDALLQWTADGRFVMVSEAYSVPARVMKIDVQTGERTLWREIVPQNPVGISGTIVPAITPDLSAWAYTLLRSVNDLYVVDGLR